MARDGNSTSVTKINLECIIFYSLSVIEDVGKFILSAPSTGVFTANAGYTIPATGVNLVVRANVPIKTTADIAITITGTKVGGGALNGTATILKGSAEGQSYDVDAGVDLWLTVASIAVVGGDAGDGFTIDVLPEDAEFEEIKFDEGMTPAEGNTTKPIFDKYDLDHNKRIRGENRLTISAFYTNNYEGLAKVKNRDVTIKMEIHDDGGNNITEVHFYDKCRLGVSIETPAGPDDNVRARAEGTFGRAFLFS